MWTVNIIDWCYDHEFVIAPPIAYDHGCVPIGRSDQWRQLASLGYDHDRRDRGCRSAMTIDHNPNYWP